MLKKAVQCNPKKRGSSSLARDLITRREMKLAVEEILAREPSKAMVCKYPEQRQSGAWMEECLGRVEVVDPGWRDSGKSESRSGRFMGVSEVDER